MDYSTLSTVLSCAREHYHSDIEKLAPLSERQAVSFGHAWHAIMYYHAKLSTIGQVMVEEDIDKVLSTLKWTDEPGDYRTAAKLKKGYKSYLERYKNTPFQYDKAESSFKFAVKGIKEPWEGRRDLIAKWDAGEGRGEELWVVDYKTTSRMVSNWVEVYRNSNQFKGYFLSAQKEGLTPAGVIVDVYHATKGVQKGKTDEDKEGNHFYRMVIRYEDFQLAEAEADFAVGATQAAMYKELGYYPKNTSACQRFGSTCAFLELCDAKSEESREKLKKGYGVNTFDPHAPMEI